MDRACIITGASSGIGEACARWLDKAGWCVFAGVRRQADAERLRIGLSDRSRPIILDVTDPDSISRALDDVRGSIGNHGLSGVVNNAGIAVAGPLEYLPLAEFRWQLEVNVIGQLAVSQACLPLLRRATGRLVLMGSIGGRMSTPFLAPYCASKFALEAIADALRVELQPWGLHVSIIEPGSVATPIWAKGAETAARLGAQFPPEVEERYGAALKALGRAAAAAEARGVSPDAVARVVEHALTARSPRTRYLVGTDAKLRSWLGACIPDRLRDRLLTRVLQLPGTGAFVAETR